MHAGCTVIVARAEKRLQQVGAHPRFEELSPAFLFRFLSGCHSALSSLSSSSLLLLGLSCFGAFCCLAFPLALLTFGPEAAACLRPFLTSTRDPLLLARCCRAVLASWVRFQPVAGCNGIGAQPRASRRRLEGGKDPSMSAHTHQRSLRGKGLALNALMSEGKAVVDSCDGIGMLRDACASQRLPGPMGAIHTAFGSMLVKWECLQRAMWPAFGW